MSEKNKSITSTELAAELEVLINNAITANPDIKFSVGISSSYDYEADLKYSSEILEAHS